MNKATIKHAFKTSLPVMSGYLVLGTGFGILLSAKGYSYKWAILMSVTIFAGSMQYVGVNILAGGADLVSAALMTLMVNARHLFYGISMIERYRGMGWRKWYAVFGLTDETYSIVSSDKALPENVDANDYRFLLTLMNQCYWIIGGVIGALIGTAFTFNSAGVDFSMTALFISIFVEQWENNKNHFPALWGLAVSAVCLIVFGADRFLIPAMVFIGAGLFAFRKMAEGGVKND